MSSLIRSVSLAASLLGAAAVPASAATWSPLTTIADGPAASAVAGGLDGSGTATILYAVGAAPNVDIYAASRPRGGSWSAPEKIANTVMPSDLKLSVSADGYAVGGWRDTNGGLTVVERAPGSSQWSVDTNVLPPLPAKRGAPLKAFNVQALPGGEALATWSRAVWDSSLPTATSYRYQSYARPAGSTTWTDAGAPAGVDPRDEGELGADADGNATLLTTAEDGGLVTATRAPGGTWSDPVELVPPGADATERPQDPQLAVSSSGAAAVAWDRKDESRYATTEVAAAVRSRTGAWSAPASIATGSDWNTGRTGGLTLGPPQVGVADDGTATVAWNEIEFAAPRTYTPRLNARTISASGARSATQNITGDTPWESPAEGGAVPTPGLDVLAVGASGAAALSYHVEGQPVQTVTRGSAGSFSAPEQTAEASARVAVTLIDARGAATLFSSSAPPLAFRTADLGAAPATTPVVKLQLRVASIWGICPGSVTVQVGAGLEQLPVTPAGWGRCAVNGSVPAPAWSRVGSRVFVLVTGRAIWPYVGVGRVVTG